MRGVRRGLSALVGLLLAGALVAPAHADAIRDAQWHLGYLHIPEAQKQANDGDGDGVTIGLLDSGVDATHPDLAGSVLPGTNMRENTGDARTDPDGHGTSMAGLIVGHGTGSNGALGIAPKATILPVRVLSGKTSFNSAGDVAKAMQWVVEHGVNVISLSLVGDDVAVLESAVKAAQQANIVVVAGVGNTPKSTAVGYPAAYDGVVAVAGVDRNGNHAAISVTGEKVLISAPATDIMSTDPGGKYSAGSGTSNATAIVAGIVALIRAKYPKLTASQVIERLTATATDKGAPGRDPEYGYGIVNPLAALSPNFKPSTAASAGPATTGSTDNHNQAGNSSDAGTARWPYIVGIIACVVLILAGAVLIVVLARRRRRPAQSPDGSYAVAAHWPPPSPAPPQPPPTAPSGPPAPAGPPGPASQPPQSGPPLIWPNQPQPPQTPPDRQA